MSERTNEFLDLYKQLEEALNLRYGSSRRYSSIVTDFMSNEDSEPYRVKLSLIREIRNLLSHNADMNGEPVIEPALGVLEDLRSILKYVVDPPLAKKVMTPIKDILFANPDQKVIPLMREMEARGFSHVPVLEKNSRFIGVFSVSTFFSYMLKWESPVFDGDTELYHFRKFLPIEKHKNEAFLFLDEKATIIGVKQAFEKKRERSRRLVAIFLTMNGSMGEPLIGMITPWDMLKVRIQM